MSKTKSRSLDKSQVLFKEDLTYHLASSEMTPCMFLNRELNFIACIMLPSNFSWPEMLIGLVIVPIFKKAGWNFRVPICKILDTRILISGIYEIDALASRVLNFT